MRGRSPFGNPLFWILAVLVVPEVAKKCKPFAKIVGDTLVGAGEVFLKASKTDPCSTTSSTTTQATAEPTTEVTAEPVVEVVAEPSEMTAEHAAAAEMEEPKAE